MAMQGRFHYYEGWSMQDIAFPIRVMKSLGIKMIIISNASGGLNPDFEIGDIMLITDHINLMGTNPLIGTNYSELGPRFPDMKEAYDHKLLEKVKAIAHKEGIPYKTGVYAGVTGPTFETPSEYKYMRVIGADAVGMSTVPEVIVAAHSGLKVLGISAITNHAAGFQSSLNHEEVVAVTQQIKEDFKTLVKTVLAEL